MLPIQLTYKNLEAVFFDFDGVLVDSVSIKTLAFQKIFASYGSKAVDLITDYHLANGGISRYKKIEYVLNQLGEDLSKVPSMADQFSNSVKDLVVQAKPIPGMIEMVKELSSFAIPAYIVSGTPEEELVSIVQRRKWDHLFHGIWGSPKTKIEIVQSILESFHYDRKKTIFIGDAATDYNTALHCKIWYIGIPEQK